MAATYTIKLDDEVSGPAKRAAGGLGRIRSALGSVGGGARAAGGALASLAAAGLAAVAAAAIAATAAILGLGASLAKSVAGAAAFQEGMEFSLERFLGSSAKAKSALKDVRKIADKLGMDYAKAAENFKELVSAGFSVDAAKEMLALKADLLALSSGTAEAKAKVESAFAEMAKSMAAGRMEADGFNRILENLPITKMQVMEKLAPKMGKSVEELMKMDITKLPVDKLIQAMKEATLAATKAKKAGEIAGKKISETWSGAFEAAKNRAKNLLFDLAAEAVPILKSIWKGLSDIPISKGEIVSAFKSVVNALKGPIESLVKAVGPLLKGIFSGFKSGMATMEPMFKALNTFLGKPDNAKAMAEGFQMLGQAIGFLAATAVGQLAAAMGVISAFGAALSAVKTAGSEAISAIGDFFSSLGSAISGAAGSLSGAAQGIGTAIINGIKAGLQAGLQAVVDAAKNVANSAINAAKQALGVSSPSRVFQGIGQQVATGMSQGMSAGSPRVAATTRDMVSAGTAAALSAAAGPTFHNKISSNPTIQVNGAASPQQTAEAVLKIQLDEARAMLEQLGISMGASTA